jgi:hypothetical protein
VRNGALAKRGFLTHRRAVMVNASPRRALANCEPPGPPGSPAFTRGCLANGGESGPGGSAEGDDLPWSPEPGRGHRIRLEGLVHPSEEWDEVAAFDWFAPASAEVMKQYIAHGMKQARIATSVRSTERIRRSLGAGTPCHRAETRTCRTWMARGGATIPPRCYFFARNLLAPNVAPCGSLITVTRIV